MSLTRLRLREAWDLGGLSTKELALRTYRAIDEHDTLNRAAVVAYYAMTALTPLLGLVLTLALGARSSVANEVLAWSEQFLPAKANAVVVDQIHELQRSPPVGLLSLSFLVLVWSSSSLFVSIMDGTNAAYGVRDGRPWWKRRLLAIVLTVAAGVLLVGASALVVAWPLVPGWLGLAGLATTLASVVQWVVVVVVLLAAFALAYYFGPNVKQEWEWITPGSCLGVLVLILASLGLRFYLHFASYASGALAGVVLMLLWLYIAALALLVGAEINCVIEHAAPHGRAPGQKEAPQGQGVVA